MSENNINSQIQRIKQNISNAYQVLENNLVERPEIDDSNKLDDTMEEAFTINIKAIDLKTDKTLEIDLDEYEILEIKELTSSAIVVNQDKILTENGEYTYDEPYTGLGSVIVNVNPELRELEIHPKIESQVFEPEEFYGYSKVQVHAVPTDIDIDISPSNIKEGVEVLGITGNVIELNATSMNIIDNGEYIPKAPYNAFNKIVVDVPMKNEVGLTVDAINALNAMTGDNSEVISNEAVNALMLMTTPEENISNG